jgi:hypothetical protein
MDEAQKPSDSDIITSISIKLTAIIATIMQQWKCLVCTCNKKKNFFLVFCITQRPFHSFTAGTIYYYTVYRTVQSRDSSVGIATGYSLDDRVVGVRVPVGSRIFTSSHISDRRWGSTQPPIQWVPGALYPE